MLDGQLASGKKVTLPPVEATVTIKWEQPRGDDMRTRWVSRDSWFCPILMCVMRFLDIRLL
jgi:hypothetical protein